jgi:hypothetical protein
MKKEVFVEDCDDEMTDEFESEIEVEDLVNEDEANEDAYIQHLIGQEEEWALIEESEEEALIDAAEEDRLIAEGERQAMIDAYIERQYVEQCLSEQEDEEVLIEQMQQQQLDDDVDVIDTIPNDLQPKQNIAVVVDDEEDDDNEENTEEPLNVTAHHQIKKNMMQRKHLDIYVKKEEISISCFGITRLKYKFNDNGWQWILNYLETGCYEDYGVDPLKVADIDCESRVKELIERGSNIARVPFLRETEAYIEICAFYRYGKLYFSIRRNDEFMNYLIEKGL